MALHEWQEKPAGRQASSGYRVWTGLRSDDRHILRGADRSDQPAPQA